MGNGCFLSDKEKAKRGEELVRNWFSERGWECEDVSEDEAYQDIDVDFIVNKNDKSFLIEVKYDDRINDTGNFFVEIVSNQATSRPGWYYYTQADYIFYIDAETDIAYVFDMEEMREYVESNDDLLIRPATDESGKISMGKLVKAKKYAEEYKLKKIQL